LQVIAITEPNSVELWDIARHHIIGSPITVTATAVAFSPDGKLLATISSDGTTDLWDTGSHQQLGGPLTKYASTDDPVLAFNPNSTMLATSNGSTITFWDVAISRQIGAIIGGPSGPFAFGANGRVLAAGTAHHSVGLWSAATHQNLGSPIQVEGWSSEFVLALSPDGKILAIGMLIGDGPKSILGVQLWDVVTNRRIGERILPSWGIEDLAFSPNGKYLAIGAASRSWLWDLDGRHIIGHS
jgi:WD40 repeat protein